MLQLSQSVRDARSAQRLCRERFQLDVSATALPGDANVNFRVTDRATGDCFVLKLANPATDTGALVLENAAMRHLAAAAISIRTQQPIIATDGRDIVPVRDMDGAVWHARLVTWLDGRLWTDATPASADRLHALGRALGEMAATLAELEYPDMHRDVAWDMRHAAARASVPLIDDERLRTALRAIMDRFDTVTLERLEDLPRSLIHNDANDNNLILDADDRLAGILDFGDMTHTWRIADLAVTGSYVRDGWDDPLAGICHVVAGYHEVNPLQEAEVAVLRDLILMRLAHSLCNSAEGKRRKPDSARISISEQLVQRLLWPLLDLPAELAVYRLREACGWEPVAEAAAVRCWLRAHQDGMASVVRQDLRRCRKAVYDFSADAGNGPSLGGDQAAETARLFAALATAGAEVGVGRYRENRSCYQGAQFGHDGEARTVHIGIDLFVPAGEPIYAPLAGTVHSFADNAQPFDYGPTIILRHEPEPGVVFFTLYGHLSRESLQGMNVGRAIVAGEQLGTIGDIPVNGGWIPHLHFQITLNMLGNKGDFPGVCRLSQAAVWESLCPNPNLILGMPESVTATHWPRS